ncbi:hypothetical protein ACF0H5_000611 [Mactra antiquata]
MAAAMGTSVSDCSICFEKFVDPKILPCFHTFCCQCLQKFIDKIGKGGHFDCPCCRAKTAIPKDGANGFQRNFYLHETIALKKIQSTKQNTDYVNKDVKAGNCDRHPDEKIAYFCNLCKVTCCRDCKIDDHDGHASVKLEAFVDQMLPQAEELLARATVKADMLKAQDVKTNDRLEFVIKEDKRIREEIKIRHNAAKIKIDERTKKALNDLKQLYEAATNSVNKAKESTAAGLTIVASISESLTEVIKSKNAIAIMEKIPESRDALDDIPGAINMNELFSGFTISKASELSEIPFENIFGQLITQRCPKELSEKLTFVSSVGLKDNDKFTLVTSILSVNDGTAWVAVRSRKTSEKKSWMKKVDWVGREKVSVTIPGLVNSIVRLDNNIAISMPFDDKICTIVQGEEMYELASLKQPTSMTVSGEDLFVSSIDSKDFRKIEANSVSRILVLSFEGQIKRSIEFYDGKPIFASPGKICSVYTGDLLVADFVKNKIIRIDVYGKELNEYCCKDTKVLGVMSDESGHILAETSDGILVLDLELNLVRTYKSCMPISDISTVTVGPGDKLWIGSVKNQISLWKYTK